MMSRSDLRILQNVVLTLGIISIAFCAYSQHIKETSWDSGYISCMVDIKTKGHATIDGISVGTPDVRGTIWFTAPGDPNTIRLSFTGDAK